MKLQKASLVKKALANIESIKKDFRKIPRDIKINSIILKLEAISKELINYLKIIQNRIEISQSGKHEIYSTIATPISNQEEFDKIMQNLEEMIMKESENIKE